LNRENEKLAEIISNIQTDQLELKQEVLRLQGELSEQYEKYRDEVSVKIKIIWPFTHRARAALACPKFENPKVQLGFYACIFIIMLLLF